MNSEVKQAEYMAVLSRVTIGEAEPGGDGESWSRLRRELAYVMRLNEREFGNFVELANNHHVIVRAFEALKKVATLDEPGAESVEKWPGKSERFEAVLKNERARIKRAVEYLYKICNGLEARGCRVAVIKSLDHWPDLGSDLDLYTTADDRAVERAMREEFGAHPVERSWGDRLAQKWNYRVPGLPELVEIHVQYLGQTGEHEELARRVIERGVKKNVGGYEFGAAAPEERLVISALQRVYRHFYFRLCDMIDSAGLLKSGAVDFAELRKAASSAGIWKGVATYLCLIQNYVREYKGDLELPDKVTRAAHSPESTVQFKDGYLRVSKATGAKLYSTQLLEAGKNRDMRALLRLPLLPPLAISALVAHSLTGNDKGIW
jgi:hypothetical protein